MEGKNRETKMALETTHAIEKSSLSKEQTPLLPTITPVQETSMVLNSEGILQNLKGDAHARIETNNKQSSSEKKPGLVSGFLKFITPRNDLERFAASFILLAGVFISWQWMLGTVAGAATLKFITKYKLGVLFLNEIKKVGKSALNNTLGRVGNWIKDSLFGKSKKETTDQPQG